MLKKKNATDNLIQSDNQDEDVDKDDDEKSNNVQDGTFPILGSHISEIHKEFFVEEKNSFVCIILKIGKKLHSGKIVGICLKLDKVSDFFALLKNARNEITSRKKKSLNIFHFLS